MGKKILLNTRMLTTPELAAADSSQNKLNTGCRSLQSSPSTVCLPFQTHLRHWWEFLFPSSPSRQGLRARKWQGCSRPKRLQKSSCWVRQDTPEGSGCRPACRTCQCTYPQKWCFRKECAAHKEEISISLIAFWYFNFDLQQKKKNILSVVKSGSTWNTSFPPSAQGSAACRCTCCRHHGNGHWQKWDKGFTVITNTISMFSS